MVLISQNVLVFVDIVMFRENIIRLNKGDWIIALTDKEFTVINNETYQYLFDKPKDVEKRWRIKRDKWACNLLPHRVSEARRAELSMLQL
jgi:hypothetical protein